MAKKAEVVRVRVQASLLLSLRRALRAPLAAVGANVNTLTDGDLADEALRLAKRLWVERVREGAK